MIPRLALLLVCCSTAMGAEPSKTAPLEMVVDHYINAKLAEDKVTPAPFVGDAGFLRRVTLDLAGRIPTLQEQNEYLADTDPAKKVKLVDRLLGSPEFVTHHATELNTVLQSPDVGRKASKKGPLYDYLVASVKENRSWDQLFRELVVPDETDAKMQGAGEFLKSRVKDLNRLTIDVSSIFFGVNVSCAQCHDHPHVPTWTQDHFYGMKSFFARTVDNGGFLGERDFGVVKYVPNKGSEKVAPVMFLTGKPIAVAGMKEPSGDEKKKEQTRLDQAKKDKKAPAPPSFSLRAKLVETALQPGERDFFSRAIANRIWHRFLGRGLVMPLDQMHIENPASHPELLTRLAGDLVENKYDLKRLVRAIVLSDVYARSSRWKGENAPADNLFAVAKVRALTPSQLAMSLRIATVDPAFEAKKLDEMRKSSEKFAALFVQPGENFQVGVAEAMMFANNEGLQKDLLEGPDNLTVRLKSEADLGKRVDLAVRTVLNRNALPEERDALVSYLRERADRDASACQQVVWALLTTAEFRFNH